MAFVVGAAIRGSVKAVQSGIQAHKDFNDPAGPQPRFDSHGTPKDPGPVYGWVMKAEKQMAERKNKGMPGTGTGEGVSASRTEEDSMERITPWVNEDAGTSRRSFEKSDQQSEDYGPQESDLDAPPAYQEVTKVPSPIQSRPLVVAGFGSPDNPPAPSQRADHGAGSNHHLARSSSLSSESSGSSKEGAQIHLQMAESHGGLLSGVGTRKEMRRELKSEHRAQKRDARAERHRKKADRSGRMA